MASLIERVLQREGYATFSSDCGTRGIEQVYSVLPHVVLLDLMMPLMDGFKVLEAMSAHAALRERPIICLTALVDRRSIERASAVGAKGYIFKPVSLPVLSAVLSFNTSAASRDERVAALLSTEPFGEVAEACAGARSLLEVELARHLRIAGPAGLSLLEAASRAVERPERVREALERLAGRGLVVTAAEGRFALNPAEPFAQEALALEGVWSDDDRRVCFVNLFMLGLAGYGPEDRPVAPPETP